MGGAHPGFGVTLVNASLWYPINWDSEQWRRLAPRGGRMQQSLDQLSALNSSSPTSSPPDGRGDGHSWSSHFMFDEKALQQAGLLSSNDSLAVTFWTHSWGK